MARVRMLLTIWNYLSNFFFNIYIHFTTHGDKRQFIEFWKVETKEMCHLKVFFCQWCSINPTFLLLYKLNLNPNKKNSLDQLLKKANIQSRILRCQLRLSYTIRFDACQTDNSRQNAQSKRMSKYVYGGSLSLLRKKIEK